jgi:hypothetical protein
LISAPIAVWRLRLGRYWSSAWLAGSLYLGLLAASRVFTAVWGDSLPGWLSFFGALAVILAGVGFALVFIVAVVTSYWGRIRWQAVRVVFVLPVGFVAYLVAFVLVFGAAAAFRYLVPNL